MNEKEEEEKEEKAKLKNDIDIDKTKTIEEHCLISIAESLIVLKNKIGRKLL